MRDDPPITTFEDILQALERDPGLKDALRATSLPRSSCNYRQHFQPSWKSSDPSTAGQNRG